MLAKQENLELVRLLNKIEWPVCPDLFDAICNNLPVNPVDLAVIRKGEEGPEVFLIYRDDHFFKGWHFPGSVILPGRAIKSVLKDVIEREVGVRTRGLSFDLVGIHQFMKGKSAGKCARGQELDVFYAIFLTKDVNVGTGEHRKFFPLNKLPKNILSHHKVLAASIKEYVGL